VRLTSFPGDEYTLANQSWWEHVVGELPESKTVQPKSGVEIEEGPFRNGNLVLAVHPIRIDWRYVPFEEMKERPVQFPNIGESEEAIETFARSMKHWFDSPYIPTIKRLAFGATLLQPVDSREAGYELLSQYLRIPIDTERSSDFMYQINKRRASSLDIPELIINRLSRWSVASRNVAQVTQARVVQLPVRLACRLELDINTVPEYERALPIKSLSSLLDELIKLGIEIAQQGTIP